MLFQAPKLVVIGYVAIENSHIFEAETIKTGWKKEIS